MTRAREHIFCGNFCVTIFIFYLLEPPKEKILATLGARSFYAAAPCLWNSLPPELRDVNSISIFKRNLKTHLFGQVFFSVLVFIKIVRF